MRPKESHEAYVRDRYYTVERLHTGKEIIKESCNSSDA